MQRAGLCRSAMPVCSASLLASGERSCECVELRGRGSAPRLPRRRARFGAAPGESVDLAEELQVATYGERCVDAQILGRQPEVSPRLAANCAARLRRRCSPRPRPHCVAPRRSTRTSSCPHRSGRAGRRSRRPGSPGRRRVRTGDRRRTSQPRCALRTAGATRSASVTTGPTMVGRGGLPPGAHQIASPPTSSPDPAELDPVARVSAWGVGIFQPLRYVPFVEPRSSRTNRCPSGVKTRA